MRTDISLFAIRCKMSINSISYNNVRQSRFLFRQNSPSVKANPALTEQLTSLQRNLRFYQNRNICVSKICASGDGASPRRVQPDKNWLKAKDSVRQTSLLSNETLTSTISERSIIEGDVKLKENQAIGLVVSAQANFMRVIVEKAGDEALEEEISASESPSVQFAFQGNGAELLKNSDPRARELDGPVGLRAGADVSKQSPEVVLDENSQVKYRSKGQTLAEGVETSGALTGYNDSDLYVGNGHSPTSTSVLTGRIDKGNESLNEDENLYAVGSEPEGHMREEPDDDDDNGKPSSLVQSNAQDCACENNKENGDLGTSLKKSLDEKAGTELLCVVRALLKKMRRRVLVGDKVFVGAIVWAGKRGMIEYAFGRKAELADPPVANVDHLLVLFSMEQPKPEPFTLTRFLVDAESTEIPFTLVLNKSDLVQEEVKQLSAWEAIRPTIPKI